MRIILLLSLFISQLSFAKLSEHEFYKKTNQLLKSDFSQEELKSSLYSDIKGQKYYNYKEARKILFGKIHLEQEDGKYFVNDVYCNNKYTKADGVGPKRIPNHQKINCEHTWPQSKFSSRVSKRYQKTDLHHLYPTNSRANSVRSNHPFGEVNGSNLGQNCQNSRRGKDIVGNVTSFEPPLEHRGNVARALFYFSIRYKIAIHKNEENYLRKWNLEDPVDEKEIARNNSVFEAQNNRNPFVDDTTLVDTIDNF